ncbi:MAG: hypothetical protein EOP45_08575 [Sphingobacteriaceae bacterium]|nr:MAG: hypothetical protein EOP45_08575 [Sphingobacteriaceae bacterium]
MNKVVYLFLTIVFFSVWNRSDAQRKSFVDVAGIDRQIKPGDNFFRFINGRWYDTVKIAGDQSGVGSYSFLNIPQKRLLQNILDSVSKIRNLLGSTEQKVGDFYASGMDMATINSRGYAPVKPILARIDAISDVQSLMKFLAKELRSGNHSVISFEIFPDNKNSGINIAHVYQAGIGLPERDYYFKTDSSTLRIQQAYKKYIRTLLQLTGSNPSTASKNADIAYGIEKQLAASHKTNVQLRDVSANYHKTAVMAITGTQANIAWTTLFTGLGAATDSIDMAQPAYYDKLNVLLKSISIDDWKIYLKASWSCYI